MKPLLFYEKPYQRAGLCYDYNYDFPSTHSYLMYAINYLFSDELDQTQKRNQ